MPQKTKKRGLAQVSPSQRSEISRQGGTAAHEQGRAHEWTSEEAREAGRKGGRKSGASRRRKKDLELMGLTEEDL